MLATRTSNTRADNHGFSPDVIEAVWAKAIPEPSMPGYARDACGNLMARDGYGDVYDFFGWEIDHRRPVEKGGTDELNNLQPLYWPTNRQKGNIYPWNCAMCSQ